MSFTCGTTRYAFSFFTRRLNVSTLVLPRSMSTSKVELCVQTHLTKSVIGSRFRTEDFFKCHNRFWGGKLLSSQTSIFGFAVLPIPSSPGLRPPTILEHRARSSKRASLARKRKSSTTRRRGLLRMATSTAPRLSG